MLFQEQFERIKAVYPGTSYVCLLDGDSGDMMCVKSRDHAGIGDLTTNVWNG